ncbi:MAG: FtsH protease activity modulator HflK [Hyphomicrobiales bacterium]|nr:FtsH protease activity modulator HflK [Hyphomicrobiales bacterium]
MPWNNQTNNGGGWKGGGGPWGQGPSGGGGGGGNSGPGGQQPDLEELLKRGQDRFRQAMPGGGVGGGFLALIIVVALVVIGFFAFTVRIDTNQQGVVLRFGEIHRTLNPGLNFRLPYPIETVYQPNVTNINRIEVGIRTNDPSGFFSSSRNTSSGQDVAEESLMLTGDENIVDIDFVVLWKISKAEDYLFKIKNPEVTVKAVAESGMREVVGQNEIQPILSRNRAGIETEVQQLMQATLDQYQSGIEIRAVQMQKVDPPQQVIASFRDVQAARADQERLQNEANAYANRVVPEARGNAQRVLEAAEAYKEQTVAESIGRTERFLQVYEQYSKAPEVTRKRMFLETMERVLGRTDKVIIDSSAQGASGVVPYLPLNELNRTQRGDNQ